MHSVISLDALKVLDAIDKKGSFSAAAEALFKVPSALTYQVQKLESELGSRLFERKGTRAQLTEVGRLVLTQGREILAATARLEDAVRQLENRLGGATDIGAGYRLATGAAAFINQRIHRAG